MFLYPLEIPSVALVEQHLHTKSVNTVLIRVTTLTQFSQDFASFKTVSASGKAAHLVTLVLPHNSIDCINQGLFYLKGQTIQTEPLTSSPRGVRMRQVRATVCDSSRKQQLPFPEEGRRGLQLQPLATDLGGSTKIMQYNHLRWHIRKWRWEILKNSLNPTQQNSLGLRLFLQADTLPHCLSVPTHHQNIQATELMGLKR